MKDETGLATIPKVIHPATGEVLELSAATEHLAATLYEARTLEGLLKDFKRAIGDELIDRMDRSASWTERTGEYEIRAPSPEPKKEYDGNELEQVLEELVGEQRIDQEAKEAAVETKIEYKPKLAGINKIRKLGGTITERIDACMKLTDPVRYASVKKRA